MASIEDVSFIQERYRLVLEEELHERVERAGIMRHLKALLKDGNHRVSRARSDLDLALHPFGVERGAREQAHEDVTLPNLFLEATVALPLNMFYNTGIATYVWVLTNRKPGDRVRDSAGS